MSFFSSVSPGRALVDKATLDDGQPTPGYVFNELARFTYDDTETCVALQDLLLKRLASSSPEVKLKALRVIRHCLLKGHRSFRSDLQRRPHGVRESMTFRAPPDPMRGENPSRMVREEAKNIMNILYMDVAEEDDAYSEHSYGRPDTVGGRSERVMEGIGNYTGETGKNGSLEGGFFSRMAKKLSKFVEDEHSASDHFGKAITVSSTYQPPSSTSEPARKISPTPLTNGPPPSGDILRMPQPYAAGTRNTRPKGRPGGVWEDNVGGTSTASTASPPEDNGTWALQAISDMPMTKTLASVEEAVPLSEIEVGNGDLERRMVATIAGDAGIRAVPSRAELSAFCSRCRNATPHHLARALQERLQSAATWKAKSKAMHAIVALLKADGLGEIKRHLRTKEFRAIVAYYIDSPQASLRKVAMQSIAMLDSSQTVSTATTSEDRERNVREMLKRQRKEVEERKQREEEAERQAERAEAARLALLSNHIEEEEGVSAFGFLNSDEDEQDHEDEASAFNFIDQTDCDEEDDAAFDMITSIEEEPDVIDFAGLDVGGATRNVASERQTSSTQQKPRTPESENVETVVVEKPKAEDQQPSDLMEPSASSAVTDAVSDSTDPMMDLLCGDFSTTQTADHGQLRTQIESVVDYSRHIAVAHESRKPTLEELERRLLDGL